jgi:uncharacterized protein (TIGR00299 family) protein
MRTLAFDGRTGASGDMLLGALVAAGADPSVLDAVAADLPVAFDVHAVDRNGISATAVDVVHDDAREDETDDHDHPADDHDHPADDHEPATDEHDHPANGQDHPADDHDHPDDGHDQPADGHDHATDDHDHTAEGAGPSRSYDEVVSIVEGLSLPAGVREDALAVFELLGEAEANVHGVDLASTHFHEVGADDAIADVVGTCALLADLDVDRVVTTPVAAGGGTVEMTHGTYPVPAPAVVELAERADWRLVGGPVDAELLTPTGAAILAHVADGVDALPELDVDDSGYGAGSMALDGHANVLRATVGESADAGGLHREDITVLETNLDDATPEVLGGLHDELADAGALDVSVVPTTMKKSRPGHIVKVICAPANAPAVARELAEATGTLGVRATGATHRWVADRDFETVTIDLDGATREIDVKVASDADGTVYDVSAEYDDAAALASETGVPTREVIRRAEHAYHDQR